MSASPIFFSASQLKTFDMCERKWGWQYIAGIKDPPGPAAALGQRVHAVLERWLRDGDVPNLHTVEGKIAQPGLEYLPLPSPALEVERQFRVEIDGLHFRGFVDLSYVDVDGNVWVVDHKTTGDFMWAKTEEDLRTDIQALLYAKQAMDRFDVDHVHLRWVYYRTRRAPKSQITEIVLTRAEVDSAFTAIHDMAAEAHKHRLTVLDPMDLTPNPGACAAFGGCPHVSRCGLSWRQKLHSFMSQEAKKMSLKDKMKARNKTRAASAATPVAAATEVPTTDPNAPEQPSEEEALSTEAAPVEAAKKKTAAKKKSAGKGKSTGKSSLTAVPDAAAAPEPANTAPVPVPQMHPQQSTDRALLATGLVSLYSAALSAGGHPDQIKAADKAFGKLQELLGA